MRAVLLVLLVGVATVAKAEWTKWSESADSELYVDLASLRIDGSLRRVWELSDYRRPVNGVRSSYFLSEYDCEEARGRILARSAYAGPMANGDLVSASSDPTDWHRLPPGTSGEAMRNLACAAVRQAGTPP